jgi:hypothetical protein
VLGYISAEWAAGMTLNCIQGEETAEVEASVLQISNSIGGSFVFHFPSNLNKVGLMKTEVVSSLFD